MEAHRRLFDKQVHSFVPPSQDCTYRKSLPCAWGCPDYLMAPPTFAITFAHFHVPNDMPPLVCAHSYLPGTVRIPGRTPPPDDLSGN